MNVSVVIPVYYGEQTIEPLVERLGQVLSTMADTFEVILVNDDSPDKSWEVIEQLAGRFPWVVGIQLRRNYGQHNATLCGVRAARYEITVTMDDDLQHPPEELSRLFAKLNEGFDVVYGTPYRLPQHALRNLMTKTVKTLLAKVVGVPSVRNISAFRAFHTYVRDAFTNFQSPNFTLDVLLSWGTSRFTSVQVNIEPSVRRSNYGFLALIKAAILILAGYSTAPLRLASWLGFFLIFCGAVVFIYVLLIYFSVGSLPDLPLLAAIISLFSGCQLCILGIFGAYLGRMFDRSMDRPSYIIARRLGGEEK
jgi:glycosyltransferase involved in cell wall biosynthesis